MAVGEKEWRDFADTVIPTLAAIDAKQTSQDDTLKRLDASISQRFDRIDKAIWGNGEPGLKEEVRRLKDFRANRLWLERAVVLAAIGVIFAGVGLGCIWVVQQMGHAPAAVRSVESR